MKYTKPILLAVGILLLSILISKLGVKEILYLILDIKWAFLSALLLALSWHMLFTISWYIMLGEERSKVSITDLFSIRIAGEALNGLTPLAALGGEPVKIHYLSKATSIETAIASATIQQTLFLTSGMVMMTIGTFISFFFIHIDTLTTIFLAISTITGITLLHAAFSHRGAHIFTHISNVFLKFKFKPAWLQRSHNLFDKLDAFIADFYVTKPKQFLSCSALHVAGRFIGIFEIMIYLHALGINISFFEAVYIWSLSMFFNQIFSFIPSSIGALEASFAFLLMTLGQDPLMGLTVGIIRRARQLTFMSLGLIFLSLLKTRKHQVAST